MLNNQATTASMPLRLTQNAKTACVDEVLGIFITIIYLNLKNYLYKIESNKCRQLIES